MSLVTVDRYRFITRDVCTDSDTVSARLEEAQALIEDEYRRPLEEAERTETVPIWPDGRVYPAAVPITAVPDDAAYAIADPAALRRRFPQWLHRVGRRVVRTGRRPSPTPAAGPPRRCRRGSNMRSRTSPTRWSCLGVVGAGRRDRQRASATSRSPSATPAGGGSSGLDSYLAGIGERTRRLWRPRLRP